jgi:hypothetical protein
MTPNNFTHQYLLELDKRITAVEAQCQQLLLQPGPLRTRHMFRQHLQARKLMLASQQKKEVQTNEW